MSLQVYAFTCGHLTGELGHLMEGGEGRIRLPIPAYLIEHPKGIALFDTGMHPDCQHDPAARLGARLTGLFEFDYHPGEEIGARLAAFGRDPAKIDLVINSHFHFDHVGGNAQIPNASMLVQRREWEAGMDPDSAAKRGFNPRDFDLGHKLRLVDGEHDVFGDARPHAVAPVTETANCEWRGRAGGRQLLFLPHFARAPAAALRLRQGGHARLARPAGGARKERRAHLFRPRPGLLAERAAGPGGDCLSRIDNLRPSTAPPDQVRGRAQDEVLS
jgi:hypothetical protein